MKRYSVIVGNIGQVHEGNKKVEAKKIYALYIAKSKHGEGRCAGEPVTLFNDNEIEAEYFGNENETLEW